MNSSAYAIRFGEGVDKGLEAQKAFPFIYTFIPSAQDTWEIDKARANLTGIGPVIPAGQTILKQVKLDADYNFLLLWIKLTCYYLDAGTGSYLWYEPVANWFGEQGDYQAAIGTPLINSIRSAVWMEAPDSRILYGGMPTTQIPSGPVYGSKIPLPMSVLQGYDFGYGQLRTPYFLPSSGMMVFQLTNTHAIKTLTVGAAIYGLKVRL